MNAGPADRRGRRSVGSCRRAAVGRLGRSCEGSLAAPVGSLGGADTAGRSATGQGSPRGSGRRRP